MRTTYRKKGEAMPHKEPKDEREKVTDLEGVMMELCSGRHVTEEPQGPKPNRHVRRILENVEIIIETRHLSPDGTLELMGAMLTAGHNASKEGESVLVGVERYVNAELKRITN